MFLFIIFQEISEQYDDLTKQVDIQYHCLL